MTAPRALLFDLDGTLVDSRRDIADTCNAALIEHGGAPLPVDTILAMVGDGARALVARAVAAHEAPPFLGTRNEAVIDAVLATFKARYLAHPCVHTVLLPGAREVLEDARAHALPCALITNKPRDITLALCEALGITGAFASVWAGGDGPLKPAPDSVLSTSARLGIAPRDAWMIGDGPQDIRAGKSAGSFTVAVAGIAERESLLASDPDLLIESLDDLRSVLHKLTAV